ncbi:putative Myo-inositol transporter 1 [Aureobasidium pullulans]|uniref:Putative Myo-inositol transporter 1 n=1 Tax=Aureobasidium pullulans TaxID=5580 RepID=A0A4S8XL86_AURPU|nr:putative Myo-inositol transporter 1 [Aureobasidium pullulans]
MGYNSTWFKPGRQTQWAITVNCLNAFFLLVKSSASPPNELIDTVSRFGYDQGVFGGLISNPDFLEVVKHPSEAFLGFIGAVLQAASFGTPQMILGRIVTGLGVGIDTSTVPMYQAELCKSHVRGRLVTTEVLFTALGIAVAYFFAFGMNFVGGAVAWRLPIAAQILPAVIISIVLFGLPETPRWLIERGRIEEATQVMCQVYGTGPEDEYIVAEKAAIIEALEVENANPFRWTHVLRKDRVQTGWRVWLAVLALTFNQWSGINVIVFYIGTVLEVNVGLPRSTALVAGGCMNLAFAVGSLVPALYLDRIGRRNPMIYGTIGLGLCLMVISILLSYQGTSSEAVTSKVSIAFFALVSKLLREMTQSEADPPSQYMLIYGTSLNAIPWCYAPEILPLKARAKGTSLAVMMYWVCSFTIVMVTPTMITNIRWKTYVVFMACNFAIAPAIYFLFPETARLSLEEIDNIFIKDTVSIISSGNSMDTELRTSTSAKQTKAMETEHIE